MAGPLSPPELSPIVGRGLLGITLRRSSLSAIFPWPHEQKQAEFRAMKPSYKTARRVFARYVADYKLIYASLATMVTLLISPVVTRAGQKEFADINSGRLNSERLALNGADWRTHTDEANAGFVLGVMDGQLFALMLLVTADHQSAAQDLEAVIEKLYKSTDVYSAGEIVKQMNKIYSDSAYLHVPAYEILNVALCQLNGVSTDEWLIKLKHKYP